MLTLAARRVAAVQLRQVARLVLTAEPPLDGEALVTRLTTAPAPRPVRGATRLPLQSKAILVRTLPQEAAVAALAVSAIVSTPLPVAQGEIVSTSAAVDGPLFHKASAATVGAVASAAREAAVALVMMSRARATRRLLPLR